MLKYPVRLTAVCNRDIQQLTLSGSGLLRLNPRCVIKHNNIILQSHESYSSSTHLSYTSSAKLTDVANPEQIAPLLTKINLHQFKTHLDELTNLQHSLQHQQHFDFPAQIKVIRTHHLSIAYAALLVAIIGIIYTAVKTTCFSSSKGASNVNKGASPTPAPRISLQHLGDADKIQISRQTTTLHEQTDSSQSCSPAYV